MREGNGEKSIVKVDGGVVVTGVGKAGETTRCSGLLKGELEELDAALNVFIRFPESRC